MRERFVVGVEQQQLLELLPIESSCASLIGDRDAVWPIMPEASKAQLKVIVWPRVQAVCRSAKAMCSAHTSEGQVIPVPKPGREGWFFFFWTSFGVLISIFGNVYPLLWSIAREGRWLRVWWKQDLNSCSKVFFLSPPFLVLEACCGQFSVLSCSWTLFQFWCAREGSMLAKELA